MIQQSDHAAKLFYSYSHRDSQHRKFMEKSLALLKIDGLLKDWSDQEILPGRKISAETRSHMDNAGIIVFLLSQDFIASEECMKEWEYAKRLEKDNPLLFRIPIILRDCAWKDFLGEDDLKALPEDGVPVVNFDHIDTAWLQVYEGIKAVVNELRNTFTVKPTFLAEMERTDFISQQHIKLQDIFVFLPLLCRGARKDDTERPDETITNPEDLLVKNYVFIHGEDRSGKTALARYLFLTLVGQSKPALYIDMDQVQQKPRDTFFAEIYQSQFSGDYSLWSRQTDKTLIVDNLSARPHLVDIVMAAKEFFNRIIVMSSSSVFYAFFRDENRLADFEELRIGVLTQVQQEILIRKRLSLTVGNDALTDGYVDRVEDRVNTIIIDDKIVPRYPFFVLCILQTYEAYMPSGLAITSYGHCYYALIVASLVRAGISSQDTDINTCFNFAEHLAFETREHINRDQATPFDFDAFVREYREEFIISDAIVNRLKHEEFGLIDGRGQFRTAYMLYFFLGRFLSKDTDENRLLIEQMSDATHVPSNYLTLLFTIHHTSDLRIIDDILLRTMCSLDDVHPAKLDRAETRRFRDIVAALPESILSVDSVESERERERAARDGVAESVVDGDEFANDDTSEYPDIVNGCYRILKNNEIMGQILRNKYGTITRDKIEEIIKTVADGGLRLVNSALKNEEEISELAQYLKTKNPSHNIQDIKRELEWLSFIWTMINVEQIVASINVPEIRQALNKVVKQVNTPAYGVIGYFALLDAARELGDRERTELANLWKNHEDSFVRSVLSIRTQHYMNTHRSKAQVEQSVCALLRIKYRSRLVQPQ